jgi:hypothetical protein
MALTPNETTQGMFGPTELDGANIDTAIHVTESE